MWKQICLKEENLKITIASSSITTSSINSTNRIVVLILVEW